jgi:hypothetical protein
MAAIHVVERLENLTRIDADLGEWESGFWVVSEDVAARLVGGLIYLHTGQLAPSHFGGEILASRVVESGEYLGRVVFRFRADIKCKNVRTSKKGWGNEKKIVW